MAQTRVGVRLRPTLWNGLLAYFTGDNTPNDILGNYNGTLVNGATCDSGIIKNGFTFDGVNDYLSISPVMGASLSAPNKAHTYSAWVYPTNLTDTYNFVFQNGDGISGTAIILNTNKVAFFYNGGTIFKRSTNTLTLNTWSHIVTTIDDSGNLRFYINGVLDSLHTGVTWSETPTYTYTQLGRYNSGANYFNGKIDEVGVWNRELSSTEVVELYNSGNAKQHPNVITPDPFWNGAIGYYTANETTYDLIGYNNGTLVNGVTYDNGIIDKCFSFNSSLVQSITTKSPVHDYSTNTTYNMWIKPFSLPGFCMFLYIPSGIQGPGIGLRPGGNLTFFRDSVNGDAQSNVYVATNIWQMITIVYRSGSLNNVDFYIDGSLVATKSLTVSAPGTGNMYIGSNGASNGVYNGLIDEISIWNTDLSPSKITELYNSGNARQYPN